MKVSLKSALLGLVLLVTLIGLVPAGLLLDRRLVEGLEQGVRDDLGLAPLLSRRPIRRRLRGLRGMLGGAADRAGGGVNQEALDRLGPDFRHAGTPPAVALLPASGQLAQGELPIPMRKAAPPAPAAPAGCLWVLVRQRLANRQP